MECQWEYEDCVNLDIKCHLCTSQGFYYEMPKKKRKYRTKVKPSSSRKGSSFEKDNHEKNQDILETRSEMTPSSGAGSIKGDEQISGIVSVMEELKQRDKTTSRGKKSFSIQKDWLEKLEKEAKDAHKDFFYLKFSYGEQENKVYVVTDEDMIMSMIKTMVEDRKTKYESEKKAKLAEKRRLATEAKNKYLEAQLDYLKAKEEK